MPPSTTPPPHRARAVVALTSLALVATSGAPACLSDLRFVRGEGDFCDLDTDCGASLYCSLETNECLPRQPNALPCDDGQACISGSCQNGVCCQSVCPGVCRSCNVPGSVGRCVDIPAGMDPVDACPGTTACSSGGRCEASVGWSMAFGDQTDQHVTGVAVGPGGDVFVAGTFRGTLNFATGPLQNPGEDDAFVARLGAEGDEVIWATAISGVGRQVVEGLAVDAEGNAYVTGWFTEEVLDENGTPIPTTGGDDGLIAAFEPDGTPSWLLAVPAPGDLRLTTIATTGDALVVGGRAQGEVTLGTCLASASNGDPDALLLTLANAGFCTNMRTVGDAGQAQAVTSLTMVDQRIVAAITGRGVVDFGSGPSDAGTGDLDVWVTSLSLGLGASWTTLVEGVGDETAEDVTADGEGGVWVLGSSTATADPSAGLQTSAERDVLLARLDADGAETSRQIFGGPYDQVGRSLTLDGGGNLLIAGDFELGVDLGDGGITANGGADVFIAKLAPDGTPLWSLPIGSRMNEAVGGLALSPAGGRIALGFDFEDEIALGVTTHRPEGGRDVLVTELTP